MSRLTLSCPYCNFHVYGVRDLVVQEMDEHKEKCKNSPKPEKKYAGGTIMKRPFE